MASTSGRGRRSTPPRRGRDDSSLRKRLRTFFSAIGFATGLVVAAGAGWLFGVVPTEKGAGSGHTIVLRLDAPMDGDALAARLEREGLLRHPEAVKLWLEVAGGGAVQPGVHVLRDDLTPRELVRRLRREKAAKVRVTFPEGFGVSEMAERLENVGICEAAAFKAFAFNDANAKGLGIASSTLEGYLYPATYDLPGNSTPAEVAKALVQMFEKHWTALVAKHSEAPSRLSRELGFDRLAIVTLASIVEKEAAVDDERPLVASVFLNRLRDPAFKPKLLQSDPTAVYGCKRIPERIPSCTAFAGKATHAIVVDEANPWTTYKHEGLPPTPIANPGEKAIEAVLAPAAAPYLYFVASGNRRHAFSATYAEHLENIKKMPR